MKAPDYFSASDRERIKNAVSMAESVTSGEIRVFIDDYCKGDVMEKAAYVFSRLGMNRTLDRNAVLIYIAMSDHQFAVIGDKGIHEKVGDEFWKGIFSHSASRFKLGEFTEAIVDAVQVVGERLKDYFPLKEGDRNELDDDMVFNGSDLQ